jgi:hypothetical protein
MQKSMRDWAELHPSVFRHAASLTRWVAASARPKGGLRYCCPVTRSFVHLTDDATLADLERPRARLRCSACGEIHLLTRENDSAAAVGRVANAFLPEI